MKNIFSMLVILAIMAISISSCDGTDTLSSDDELHRMAQTQTDATIAAAKLQGAKVEATSRADATRQFLILQGQQTRIAQEAMTTQTTFAQRAGGTATAASVLATASIEAARGTSTRQTADNTATAVAAQYTQAAQARDSAATDTANRINAEGTKTVQAVMVQQTQVAASATATKNAVIAQSEREHAQATATVEKAQTDKQVEIENQAKAQEQIKSWGMLGVLAAFLVGLGFLAIRFADAFIFRIRVIRDRTGVPFVITERDRQGRQTMLAPTRQPGAVTLLTPPEERPLQVEAGAIDPETTKRDQAVSLMLAANFGKGGSDELMEQLTEGDQIKFVDEPPSQMIAPDTKQLLDGQWKEITDGKS